MVVFINSLLGTISTRAIAQTAPRLNIPPTGSSPAPNAMSPSVATPNPYGTGSYGSTYGATGSAYSAPSGTYGSSYNVAPASPYGAASGIASPYPNSGTMSSVPVTSGNVAGPLSTFQGGSLAPPPTWDPYAPPGTTSGPALLPADYYPTVPTLDMDAANQWRQKFMQELRADYYYIPARGSNRFGTNDLELSATFAFPFLYNEKTPLLVTPGFAFHWWEGPVSSKLPPASSLNYLPPRVYDAYLDTAWNPQMPNMPISGELAFRAGVYSDFRRVTAESLRYTGHGFMVVALQPERLKAKLGIVYYDRVKIKMLPAGGLVWTPNDAYRFDILFPNPMFSRRMTTMGTTDLWLYLRGEYGGGSWILTPDAPMDYMDQFDYNDMRAALGIEFANKDERRMSTLVEVGVAFERELVVRSTGEEFSPSTTIFLRAAGAY